LPQVECGSHSSAELVTIEPTWRGYMYFVSGDEISSSSRVVAVLDV
jgi:hypothetical protein